MIYLVVNYTNKKHKICHLAKIQKQWVFVIIHMKLTSARSDIRVAFTHEGWDDSEHTSLWLHGATSQSKHLWNTSPFNTATLTPKTQAGWTACSGEWGITVSQRPLGASLPEPRAGNSPVAKNNIQTDDCFITEGDHTVHVLLFQNFPWNNKI